MEEYRTIELLELMWVVDGKEIYLEWLNYSMYQVAMKRLRVASCSILIH